MIHQSTELKQNKQKQTIYNYQLTTREKLEKLFESNFMKVVFVLITFYILFADDIRLLCTAKVKFINLKEADFYFSSFAIFIMLFFTFELISNSIIYDDYFLSLFFTVDFLALFSLLLDIQWVTEAFVQYTNVQDRESFSNRYISIIRLARIIRLSTRVTRILRICRLLKIFKIFNKTNLDYQEQSKVGRKLEEKTMKRLITLILLMLFAIVFLATYFYYNQLTFMEFGINIFNQYQSVDRAGNIFYNVTLNVYVDRLNDPHVPLLYAEIYEDTFGNKSKFNDLRFIELLEVWALCNNRTTSATYARNPDKVNYNLYNCYAVFDNRAVVRYSTLINIAKTLLIIVILAFGVIYFNKDMNDLVLEPIEKMTMKIKNLSKNPIAALMKNKAEEVKEIEKAAEGCCAKREKEAPLETVILEQTLSKISALLALGFGEAGAEIISKNIGNKFDVDIDPTIRGKKVMGVYGFCDIRNFTDSTEILQEKVMIFVNEIAEIVHETTSEFGGSANKNIGDAFLLVWKFEEKFVKKEGNEVVLSDSPEVTEMVDMALIAFLKVLIRCHKSEKLNEVKFY
jgi:hypothetical protein